MLSPAEDQVLQAAQLAQLGPSGPPLPTPGAAGATGIQPYSVTTQPIGPNVTSGSDTKIEGAEAQANRRAADAKDLEAAKIATRDITAVPNLSPEEIEADVRSKEQSELSIQRQQAANPAPNAAALPPAMGIPLGMAQNQAPAPAREYTSQDFAASTAGGKGGLDVLTGQYDKSAAKQAALTGGIAGPQTLSQEKDEVAARNASMLSREKDLEVAKREEVQRRATDAVNNWQQQFEQARSAAEKASKITTLAQDSTPIQNFLRAVASGMGAYAAIRTGSPNFAQQVITDQINKDFEIKKANLDFAITRLDKLGVDRARLDGFEDREMAKFLAAQSARIDQFKAASEVAFAKFPQAQQAAQAAAAQGEAKVADMVAERAKGIGERTAKYSQTMDGGSIQTVEGKDQSGGGRAIPPTADVLKGELAKENEKNAIELKKLASNPKNIPTPDQIQQIRDNQNAWMARWDEEKKSTWQGLIGKGGRMINAFPTSIFPSDMSKGQREVYLREWQLAEPKAIQATGGTTFMGNPETYIGVMGNLVQMPWDTPESGAFKINQTADYSISAGAAVRNISKVGQQEQKFEARQAPRPVGNLTGSELLKLSPVQRASWQKAKMTPPTSPHYGEAQEVLKKAEAVARGGQ